MQINLHYPIDHWPAPESCWLSIRHVQSTLPDQGSHGSGESQEISFLVPCEPCWKACTLESLYNTVLHNTVFNTTRSHLGSKYFKTSLPLILSLLKLHKNKNKLVFPCWFEGIIQFQSTFRSFPQLYLTKTLGITITHNTGSLITWVTNVASNNSVIKALQCSKHLE